MSAAKSLRSGWELVRSQWFPLLLLTAWMLAPLAVALVFAIRHGYTLTGALGYDPFDQMAYLAWIRDSGSHVLASDLWQVGPTAHDYLHPTFTVSGLLWRAGLSLQVAYLIWKPVALLVLFLGFAAYVRRRLPGHRLQQTAALVLALFYLTPALALARWTGHLTVAHRLALQIATYDSDSALNLWGFEHAAIAIGLMPVFLIAVERTLGGGAEGRQPGVAAGGGERGRRLIAELFPRQTRALLVVAALAGALVSWMQPWQGVTLLGVIAAMVVLVGPRRRYLSLSLPIAGLVAPLLYGEALSRYDSVWHEFAVKTQNSGGVGPWWALVVGFLPLVIFAGLGLRRPRDDASWLLALWVVACVLVYLLVPEFPPHALKGVTLPLSVLAVGGWERCRRWGTGRVAVGRAGAAVAAVAAIALFTVPAGIAQMDDADAFTGKTISDQLNRQLVMLSPAEVSAMHYLQRQPTPGPVLAPWFLSMSIPAYTGRQVFAGHPMWQPASNVQQANVFYSLADPGAAARRAILSASGARFVLTQCGTPSSLGAAIAPVATPVARYGCLTIYRVRTAIPARPRPAGAKAAG
ncbi:MAG: hypothetical protein WAK93_17050 [Solirubrobacteraceae bacterium]